MKFFFAFIISTVIAMQVNAQQKPGSVPDPKKKIQVVEASCGLCQFEMKADECSLAVRTDGKLYIVDGTDIDAHGDAHAPDGFCQVIRKAEVQGEVINGRFRVSYFKLLPLVKE